MAGKDRKRTRILKKAFNIIDEDVSDFHFDILSNCFSFMSNTLLYSQSLWKHILFKSQINWIYSTKLVAPLNSCFTFHFCKWLSTQVNNSAPQPAQLQTSKRLSLLLVKFNAERKFRENPFSVFIGVCLEPNFQRFSSICIHVWSSHSKFLLSLSLSVIYERFMNNCKHYYSFTCFS